MQTFVPCLTYEKCAAVLDYRRLGKQRVEVLQIHNALTNKSHGWARHPAVLMWDGCEVGLLGYGITMCKEWINRGYNDSLLPAFSKLLEAYDPTITQRLLPWWWGDARVHSSHRASLLMKDPTWYSQFGWTETPNSAYWWPTHEGN